MFKKIPKDLLIPMDELMKKDPVFKKKVEERNLDEEIKETIKTLYIDGLLQVNTSQLIKSALEKGNIAIQTLKPSDLNKEKTVKLIEAVAEALVQKGMKNVAPAKESLTTKDNLNTLMLDYLKGSYKPTQSAEQAILYYSGWYICEKIASDLTYEDSRLWMRAPCPICGRIPHLKRMERLSTSVGAGIDMTEQRNLFQCSYCNSKYHARSCLCPVCGNQDCEKFAYYRPKDVNGIYISYCDVCKHYVKDINEELLGAKIHIGTEDTVTYMLDVYAKKLQLKQIGSY